MSQLWAAGLFEGEGCITISNTSGRKDEDCSCGGTGFDWTDTVDARRTVEAAIEGTS